MWFAFGDRPGTAREASERKGATMTKVYIRLNQHEIERLSEDARAERRNPADHAAWLIARALDARPQLERNEVLTS